MKSIDSFLRAALVLALVAVTGCSNRQPTQVVSVQHNGFRVEARLAARKSGEVKVHGTVKVVNETGQRRKFRALQLFLLTNADRYITQREFPLAFLKDNSPLEIAPGDSLRLNVFWYTGAAFDTSGIGLEYNDFASAGMVHIKNSRREMVPHP